MDYQLHKTVAAVCLDKQFDFNRLIDRVISQLHQSKIYVQGFVQREIEDDNCRSHTYLENIENGVLIQISQDLGDGSISCKLDANILATLSEIALDDLDRRPDFLIINRFGRGEAEGHGFRDVIGKACALEIPVFCAVKKDYWADWNKYTGDISVELPPREEDIITWSNGVMTHSCEHLQTV